MDLKIGQRNQTFVGHTPSKLSHVKEVINFEILRKRQELEPLLKRNTRLYQDSKNSRQEVLTTLVKWIHEDDIEHG